MAENAENTAPLASSEPSDKNSAEIPAEIPAGNQTASSPAPHEHDSRGETPAQTSFGERLGQAAGGVFEKFKLPFKKGRGRPRNDGKPGKGDVVSSSGNITHVAPLAVPQGLPENSPMAAAVAPVPADSVRAQMFRKACSAAVKGLLGILSAVVKTYASAAGIREEFSTRVLKNAEASPTDLAEFTDSLDAVLKKHSIQPKNTEEIALAINFAKLMAPYAMLVAEFRGEIRRQRDEKEKSFKA